MTNGSVTSSRHVQLPDPNTRNIVRCPSCIGIGISLGPVICSSRHPVSTVSRLCSTTTRGRLSGESAVLAAGLHPAFHITIASAIDRVSGGDRTTASTTNGSATSAWVTRSSVAHAPDGALIACESGSMVDARSVSRLFSSTTLLGKAGGGGGSWAGTSRARDTKDIAPGSTTSSGALFLPTKTRASSTA